MSLQHGTAAFAASSVLLAGAASGQGGYQLFHNASLVTDSDGEASLLNPLGLDFNGDGVPDLLVLRRGESGVRMMLSTARGRWGEPEVVAQLPDGTLAQDVAAADVDGDGDHDLVYWGIDTQGGDQMRFGSLLNDGFGAFSASPPAGLDGFTELGLRPFDRFDTIGVGDVTGDGVPDLVVTERGVIVLPGDGTGLFGPPEIIPRYARAVEVFDFDRDGVDEIAFIGSGNAGLSILRSAGAVWKTVGTATLDIGPLNATTLIATPRCDGQPGARVYAATVERSYRGDLQSVLVGEDFAITPGAFGQIDDSAVSITAADVMGESCADLILSSGEVFVDPEILDGLGEPIAFAWGSFGASSTADIDLDGDRDIIISERASLGLSVITGEGEDRSVRAHPINEVELPGFDGGFSGITSGDFDGDGLSDVFISTENTPSSAVFYQESDGTFSGSHLPQSARSPRAHAADLDGDGLDDVLLVTSGVNIQVNFAEPGRAFAPRVGLPVGAEPREARAGDVDGDGVLDIVAHTVEGLVVFRQTAPRSFVESDRVTIDGSRLGLAVGDLNGDGLDDIVVGSVSDFGVQVVFSTGGGSLGSAVSVDPTTSPESISLADLDLDGDLDMVVASEFEMPSVRVYANDGAGSFSITAEFGMSFSGDFYGTQWVEAADVNGDGYADLVLANQIGIVETLVGKGGFEFARSVQNTTRNAKLNQFVIADLNNDDFPDAAVISITEGSGFDPNSGGFELLANLTTPRDNCRADFGTPFGTLTPADPDAFVTFFLGGNPDADLAAPFGILDLADIAAFVAAFLDGCG